MAELPDVAEVLVHIDPHGSAEVAHRLGALEAEAEAEVEAGAAGGNMSPLGVAEPTTAEAVEGTLLDRGLGSLMLQRPEADVEVRSALDRARWPPP